MTRRMSIMTGAVISALTIALLLMTWYALPAAVAQSPRTLKMQATWPASSLLFDNFKMVAERVEKLSGGRLKINVMIEAGHDATVEAIFSRDRRPVPAERVSNHIGAFSDIMVGVHNQEFLIRNPASWTPDNPKRYTKDDIKRSSSPGPLNPPDIIAWC